jgi:GH25 family lysozyme M1 (1,4-beta-N-acetylmuramidase)
MAIVRRVLDLSHHNSVNDLNAVKQAGIYGIIHKATEATSYKDDKYPGRKKGFLEIGLLWGAYHFLRPGNASNINAQVDYFLSYAGIDDQTLYALDWEDNGNGEDDAVTFCQRIEQKTGRKCAIYSGNTAKENIHGVNEYLGSHRLWLAQYSSSCSTQASWNNNVWLWQYSDGVHGPGPHGCPGCTGEVDTNSWTGTFEELQASWAGYDKPPAPWPDNPLDVPLEDRPTLSKGDTGHDVSDLQELLNETELEPGLVEDGDFGNLTEEAVYDYQGSRGLDYDGLAGQQTWGALYADTPPLPPPPHALSQQDIAAVCEIANGSAVSNYSWHDRGVAPRGYTQGMALAFAQTYKKLQQGHPAAVDMAKARVSSDKDALHVYWQQFEALGMSNETAGIDTLRHLYALMLGHGMRESSGRHCEGRDQSASNTSSDTAEAGLFQTSYNAHGASDPEFDDLMAEYSDPANKATCYLSQFDDEVSCSSSEWSCYGSGQGYAFQELAKECPSFAVETCGLTLRNLCNHYGPIVRGETELKSAADDMFRQVQDYIDAIEVA